jgi:hypothetical protein
VSEIIISISTSPQVLHTDPELTINLEFQVFIAPNKVLENRYPLIPAHHSSSASTTKFKSVHSYTQVVILFMIGEYTS